MSERLAEIITECLPEKYIPVEALTSLFSHNYFPEQDHEHDFLLALHERYTVFTERTLHFYDELKKGINADGSLYSIAQRTLEQWKYSLEDVLRNPTQEHIFFETFSAVSPTSLIALWTIKHQSQLTDKESAYFVETIGNWPAMDKKDSRRASIYSKFKPIAHQKFSVERRERRQRVHASGECNDLPHHYQIAQHDLDHQFLYLFRFLAEVC